MSLPRIDVEPRRGARSARGRPRRVRDHHGWTTGRWRALAEVGVADDTARDPRISVRSSRPRSTSASSRFAVYAFLDRELVAVRRGGRALRTSRRDRSTVRLQDLAREGVRTSSWAPHRAPGLAAGQRHGAQTATGRDCRDQSLIAFDRGGRAELVAGRASNRRRAGWRRGHRRGLLSRNLYAPD